jgi:hypothetical protein
MHAIAPPFTGKKAASYAFRLRSPSFGGQVALRPSSPRNGFAVIAGGARLSASRRMGHGPHGSRRPLTRAPHHQGPQQAWRNGPRLPDGQISGLAVQSRLQKYSCFRSPQITSRTFASHPTRGAYRDRHGRGVGCGGRGSVLRATGSQGESKDL